MYDSIIMSFSKMIMLFFYIMLELALSAINIIV